jgi:hypothetical protein
MIFIFRSEPSTPASSILAMPILQHESSSLNTSRRLCYYFQDDSKRTELAMDFIRLIKDRSPLGHARIGCRNALRCFAVTI